MKEFVAPSASLTAPDDWRDGSTYILAGPREPGFTPTIIVTQTPDVLDGNLERQIERQLLELQRLSNFRLVSRSPVKATAIGDMAVLEFQWDNDGRGQWVYQRQMYVMSERTLYTITATVPLSLYTTLLPKLTAIMDTFRPRRWANTK